MPHKIGVFFLFLTTLLATSTAFAAQGWIDAWGEAQIKNGNKIEAKQVAVADGLKRCIEKIVGVTVESQFDSTMKEVVKNNQNQFSATVQDRVIKRSKGFIDKYEVLEEKVEMDVMKVHVKALVYEDKLVAEVEKITELINKCGSPKLMIVIQDVHTSPDGKETVAAESLLGMHLENMMMKRGLEIRGKRAAKKISGGSARKYDRWSQETDNIVAMAAKNKADMLVFGRVEIHNKGIIENSTFKALNGQIRIEIATSIRGINAVTGELFSSKPDQMSSMGINLERAVVRALKGRGQNLVTRTFDPLFEDLKVSCQKAAEQGRRFVVVIDKVKSFRKQANPFVELVKGMDGIAGVEHTFQDGKLSIDLSCDCTASELQDRIFGAVDASGNAAFSDIDLAGVTGNKLRFKL